MCGEHEVDFIKLARLLGADWVELGDESTLRQVTGTEVAFAGPIRLRGVALIVADVTVEGRRGLMVGANAVDRHDQGVHQGRDLTVSVFADLKISQ